jgi:DNA replication protein DnaC
VNNALNITFTGRTGVGKTWLACALGQQAIRKRFSVAYWRLSRLLEQVEIGHGDGTLTKLRAQLAKTKVLILDDWGLAPMTDSGRRELLEIIEDRYGSASTMITSQLPIDKWHDYIGEPTYADSILDRFLHRTHRIELRGESLRKQHALPMLGMEDQP